MDAVVGGDASRGATSASLFGGIFDNAQGDTGEGAAKKNAEKEKADSVDGEKNEKKNLTKKTTTTTKKSTTKSSKKSTPVSDSLERETNESGTGDGDDNIDHADLGEVIKLKQMSASAKRTKTGGAKNKKSSTKSAKEKDRDKKPKSASETLGPAPCGADTLSVADAVAPRRAS